MDFRTKSLIAALSLSIGIITNVLSIVKDGPSVVQENKSFFLFFSIVALIVGIITVRDRIDQLLQKHLISTTISTVILVVMSPPLLAYGIFSANPLECLHIATFSGVIATIAAIILVFRASSQQAMSYNGTFPNNIQDVIELLEQANKNIKILTDVVAYGAFSAPREHDRIVRTLVRKKRDDSVEVTWRAYNQTLALQLVKEQLKLEGVTPGSEMEKGFLNSDNISQFISYFHNYSRPTSIDDFFAKVFRRRNEETIEYLQGHFIKVKADISRPIPIYFWMVDDKRAVFSFSCRSAQGLDEYTFITSDPGTLRMLNDIVDTYGEE